MTSNNTSSFECHENVSNNGIVPTTYKEYTRREELANIAVGDVPTIPPESVKIIIIFLRTLIPPTFSKCICRNFFFPYGFFFW